MILYFPLFLSKGALQDFGVELNLTRSNLQTSGCRNLWLSLIHPLRKRSEDGFTLQIEYKLESCGSMI